MSESTEEPNRATGNEYLDDDLAVLASEDTVAASSESMTAVIQGEDFMVWSIEGLYNEDTGRVNPPRVLKADPPVLHIENKRDDEVHYADFLLTRKLARTLEKGLKTTNRAYNGVADTKFFSKEGLKLNWNEFQSWISEHRVAAIIIGALFAFFILFGFIL